jgi:hypothetical protein
MVVLPEAAHSMTSDEDEGSLAAVRRSVGWCSFGGQAPTL